jgi:hypothetical protein
VQGGTRRKKGGDDSGTDWNIRQSRMHSRHERARHVRKKKKKKRRRRDNYITT